MYKFALFLVAAWSVFGFVYIVCKDLSGSMGQEGKAGEILSIFIAGPLGAISYAAISINISKYYNLFKRKIF